MEIATSRRTTPTEIANPGDIHFSISSGSLSHKRPNDTKAKPSSPPACAPKVTGANLRDRALEVLRRRVVDERRGLLLVRVYFRGMGDFLRCAYYTLLYTCLLDVACKRARSQPAWLCSIVIYLAGSLTGSLAAPSIELSGDR